MPRRKAISTQVDQDVLAEIDKLAEKENRSRANMIEHLLIRALEFVKKV